MGQGLAKQGGLFCTGAGGLHHFDVAGLGVVEVQSRRSRHEAPRAAVFRGRPRARSGLGSSPRCAAIQASTEAAEKRTSFPDADGRRQRGRGALQALAQCLGCHRQALRQLFDRQQIIGHVPTP